ncbi:MAG: transglycosylase SLT domain-containing protein [Dongiaceae bacterium]
MTPYPRFFLIVLLAWLALPGPAWAVDYCTPYIQRAEIKYRLPKGMLKAIALAESGKGGMPWPWAVNIGGEPYYPDSYEEAVKLVRDNQGNPRRNVAIGCMQIHMAYHLNKVSAIEWFLHPEVNVTYGAQLLRRLYQQHGNWTSAVGYYHAGNNKKAQYDYVCDVWRNMARVNGRPPSSLGKNYCKLQPRTVHTPPSQRAKEEEAPN